MIDSLYSMEECERVARLASLRYVNDTMPGITRQKQGDEFLYFKNSNQLTDENTLARIKNSPSRRPTMTFGYVHTKTGISRPPAGIKTTGNNTAIIHFGLRCETSKNSPP